MLQFEPWKIALVVGVCLLGLVYASPNLVESDYSEEYSHWLPVKKVNLGLDLQGGSHLLLEVDTALVVRERLDALVDQARRELRSARLRYRDIGIRDGRAQFTIPEAAELEQARSIAAELEAGTTVEVTDGGTVRIAYTEEAIAEMRLNALLQSIEIVRRRIDETGVREPTIQRQGEDRILLQLPGVDDPDRVKALLGQTAKMTFHLVDTGAAPGQVPAGTLRLPAANAGPGEPEFYVVERRIMVSGDSLVDASAGFDQNNRPSVNFRFDASGGRVFGRVTTENVGRPFAIVLDGKVISAPVIREPILGGSGQITGNFTVQEAQDLALLLRAGALPAPLVVLEERTVGPGLGADSIAAGKLASVIGLAAVVVFMVVSYGRFGLMADVALLFNIALIVASLSILGATLTLPGIAGIVLTIGMAVDANVLIFERIREEIANGRTPIASIDAGYRRALTTIIDSNLTTLFAATCLYAFGSGPVKGFAVTLAIGILTSMFTAIMLTRLLVVLWVRRARPSALPI